MNRTIATLVIATSTLVIGTALPAAAKTPKAPASCLAAIAAAETVRTVNSDLITAQQRYFQSLSDAGHVAQANPTMTGLTTMLQMETAALTTYTGEIQAATGRISAPASTFNAAASKCRAGK